MKKTILLFLLCFSLYFLNAQDIIYTVKSTINGLETPADSILVENISNGTRILFNNLPDLNEYTINLTQKALWGLTMEKPHEQNPGFKVTSNYPGFLCLTYNHDIPNVANIFIYNMQGQKVYNNKNQILLKGNSIRIFLGRSHFYVVKIQSSFGLQGFKVLGSPDKNLQTRVSITSQANPFHIAFSKPVVTDDNFSYHTGDSIRISAYKHGYYAFPKSFQIAGYDSIVFPFKVSHVDSTGISDAYVNLSDTSANITITDYNTENGNIQISYTGKEPDIHPGEVITIDLDTAGYLRQVVNVVKKDSTVTLTTTAAKLEDIFVNQDLKLDTKFITPQTILKSTSSYKEISKALTDKNGYIHPVKIIYHDNQGRLKSKSVFKNSEKDTVRINIIDFYKSLKTNLYGKDGDDVHFYIDQGHMSLISDAVFDIKFKDSGSRSRKTKAKIGNIRYFSFYLDSQADFLIKLAFDLNKAIEKENTEKLIDIPKARAEFVVPPGIPVWITFNCDIYGRYFFSSDTKLHADWGFESKHTLKVGGSYDVPTNRFKPIKEYTPTNTIFPLNVSGEINDSARLELYPRVNIKLYGHLGPFAEIVPYVTGSYHAKYQGQFSKNQTKNFLAWNSAIDLGLDLRVGIVGSIFRNHDIIGPINIPCFDKKLWDSPSGIQLMSNIPSSINVGENVSLLYKVTDLWGNPVIGCSVYVDGNGSFDRQLALTGSSGEASFTWTAGNPGNSKITATIFQADKAIIQQKNSTIFVNNPPPPVADFSAVPKSGSAPLTVNFIDQSTNNPTQWQWDFGDGLKSTEKSPTHKYASAGKYTVSLTASSNYGENTKSKSDYIIAGNLPVADFTADKTTGKASLTVNFTDHSTGKPASWSWEFGDGGVSAERNPSHKYRNAGIYTVRLTVTNQFGTGTPQTKEDYINVEKSGSKPTADFTGSPVSGSASLRVQFINNSSGSPTSYHWDFGDGVTSNQQSPVHNYQKTGKYTVTLTATNEFGQDTKTEPDYINVNNTESKLTANFSANPISGTAPLTVYFTNQSTGNPTSYHWDFGDEGSGSQKSPTHVYQKSGTYSVSLTVSNGADSDTKTKSISVQSSGSSLAAYFKASPLSGTAPLTVNFTDQSTGNPTSWTWDFGDGINSSAQSPNHTYNKPGSYTVKLKIAANGDTAIAKQANLIKVISNEGTFTDSRDGQTYKTIKIGSQTWMAQNLNYKTGNSWWYNNDPNNGAIYGRLYRWDSAQTACPDGWHLPRENEWKTLFNVLGGESSAGGKMKETGTAHWSYPNTGASDSVGFKALPGGIESNGKFYNIGDWGNWWSSTSDSYPTLAIHVELLNDSKGVTMGTSPKSLGYSVRCVKN